MKTTGALTGLLLLAAGATPAAVIDFDATYGVASGWTLVQNIKAAISSALPGDLIQFNSPNYDFAGQGLSVDSAVTLRGNVPAVFDPNTVGATNVTTVFNNIKHLNVRSSGVTLQHLEIHEDVSTTYMTRYKKTIPAGEDPHQFYTNIVVENVIFYGGTVQAFGGDGAGIEFRNCSFLQFRSIGYHINRKNRVDYAPRTVIRKCLFRPDFSAVNFNVRAISLDAGNTEYPVVWDQNNTLIDSCMLDGTGLGVGSKCSNVTVTNCYFKGYRMDVDMIHIEEFGHHFEVVGNTFEHISPARGIYIDRGLQQNSDIRIAGNTWLGAYGWIISAHSPENLLFENNDFSGAWANNPGDKTIDLTYFADEAEEGSYLPYDLPCSGIVFSNNTGLAESKDGYLAYKSLPTDASIRIDYPSNKVQQIVVSQAPRAVFSRYRLYRIKNKLSGEYAAAVDGSISLAAVPGPAADYSDLWELSFKYPYFYHLRNVKTGQYMEVYRGYTLGDLQSSNSPPIYVEQQYSYAGKSDIPFWYFRLHGSGASAYYEIFPGANERKSRMVQVGNSIELEFATVLGTGAKPPTDESSWILEPMDRGLPGTMVIAEPNAIFTVTNGPANGWFSLISKTNMLDVSWTTNQTGLPLDAMGRGAVTNLMTAPHEFYRLIESEAPPLPVIEFTAPDYSNGLLNGQQVWNAESAWTVADAAGLGYAATAVNSVAVMNVPVTLTAGQIYSLSVNLQFGGSYATPTGHVYAFLGGLKADSAGASVSTGGMAADANIQIIANTDNYRLLNNWSSIGSTITTGTLNAGDVLQFDYELTLGVDAASTSYKVRLQNLTDGTDTGLGTGNGVDAAIYTALTGSGAYGFFQSINPGNHGSGLSGVQVNSVSAAILP